MKAGAAMLVTAVRAIEHAYGQEGVQVIREAMDNRTRSLAEDLRKRHSVHSLDVFARELEQGCRLTHEWSATEHSRNRRAYRFVKCLWADVFRELGAADIGFWICAQDGPFASAFNQQITFTRSKTLMQGDDCCDHCYYLDEAKPL